MDDRGFEEIEHTADVALAVWGADLATLFANAARGMAYLLAGAEPIELELTMERLIELSAYDVETLLVSWLEELLYLSEESNLLFTDFAFDEIGPRHLRAKARGGPVDRIQLGIKAVTFSEIAVQGGERGLETNIVFDV
jgi:SHS2 domain-containing protein